jgi:hypothetical protein
MSPTTHKTVVLAIFILLTVAPSRSSAQVTNATLSGRVEDEHAATVVGAHVAITNVDKNKTWNTTTDAEGRFSFLFLPAGSYELAVERTGFNNYSVRLPLTVGETLNLPIKLTVIGVSGNVNIMTDAVPLIETSRSELAQTVTPREIDTLPLNGRNYLDLALLVPTVSRTNTGSNQRFAETSAVPGTGLSFAGQRNLNNSFIVDGLSANDDAADLAGTSFSEEVIREFQVVTSGGIAEFGRSSGGIVNIITQSGTKDWRGRIYGFLRNQRFDARNPLAPNKDPLTQTQYGGSVGGPIKRDRTFLFTNFEQTRRHDVSVITIAPSNVSAINSLLNQAGYKGPRVQTGIVPGGYDVTNFFARVDHQLNNKNMLAARYTLYDVSSINSRTVGGLNDVSRGTSLKDRDQTIAVQNVTTLSTRSMNEARFQFTHSRLAAPANDAIGPAVNISGVASFGTATSSPTARVIDLYEFVDNVSAQRGAHALKGGVDLLLNRVNISFPGVLEGVYTFSSLANLQSSRYTTYQQAFGAPSQYQSNPNLGLFVQDEWRVRPNLTINWGLRYDAQFLPEPIQTDANNFSPRIGVSYSPGDRKTVIRASFGLFYDRIPLRATSNALQRDGTKYQVAVLSFGQAGAPVFPNTLASFPTGLLKSITLIDPRIESSYSEQGSFQIERELPAQSSVSLGLIHLRGVHILLSRNVNVPRFPASAGVPNLGRPDPRFANVSRYESSGDSYYNGMFVTYDKRAARWASVRFSYTFSKSMDNAGNFFFFAPQDNSNLRDERGLSDNDQRHRISLSGSLEVPAKSNNSAFRRAANGLQLSYIFSYASRLPFNVQTGADRNFDTNSNDRPVGIGRNTGRGFNFASLDLRLSRKFRFTERVGLQLIAEGFNVFNRANLQIPNNIFGTGVTPLPTFGRPTAAGDPRQIQFGVRLDF